MEHVSRQCCYWIVGFALSIFTLPNISHGETTTFSLTRQYRFSLGNDPNWAKPAFDDTDWKSINVPGGWMAQGFDSRPYVGWYRVHFLVPEDFGDRYSGILIGPVRSAYEIYLNGKLIGAVGNIDQRTMWSPDEIRQRVFTFNAHLLNRAGSNVLAIRVQRIVTDGGIFSSGITIGNEDSLRLQHEKQFRRTLSWETAFLVFYGSTFLFSLILYALGFRDKKHFWFAVVILQIGLSHFLESNILENLQGMNYLTKVLFVLVDQSFPLSTLMFLKYALHTTFGKYTRILIGIYVLCCLAWWINIDTINSLYLWWVLGAVILFVPVALFWCWRAIRHHQPDGWPLLIGTVGLFLILGFDIYTSLFNMSNNQEDIYRWCYVPLEWYAWLCVHLSMIYILAAGYERTRRQLHKASQRILQAHEDERRRIARDLHDGIGQSLLAVKLQLDLLGGQVSAGTPATPENLRQASNDADQIIDEVRRIVEDLHPDAISRVGLVQAIRNFVEILGQRIKISIEIEVNNLVKEDITGAEHLYRIIQEGVHNSIRHGKASLIKIIFEQKQNVVYMIIQDDGEGFDINAEHDQPRGVGLTSMCERAELIGGKLEIQSQLGKGTTVKVEAPVS